MFATELEMSIKFENFLKANLGDSYLRECPGLTGIPDFIFYASKNKEIAIVSFELKLKNWKRATKQAFRYKTFSNISYVVLESRNTTGALKNIELFEKYNIGLASFNPENDFNILFKPNIENPYSKSLNKKVLSLIGSSVIGLSELKPSLNKKRTRLRQLGLCN